MPTLTELATARNLVFDYEQAYDDNLTHMHYCFDQEEKYGCESCRGYINREHVARKAMEANPLAMEYYKTDESKERRRNMHRSALAYYAEVDRNDEDGYYYDEEDG